jgi:hypothetical protein
MTAFWRSVSSALATLSTFRRYKNYILRQQAFVMYGLRIGDNRRARAVGIFLLTWGRPFLSRQ